MGSDDVEGVWRPDSEPGGCRREAGYWDRFEYDRQQGCIHYGRANCYSWGWVVDDFGFAVMPLHQVSGFGMHEASLHVH